MRFSTSPSFSLLFTLLSTLLFSAILVSAQGKYPTSVWVTQTLANGRTTQILSPYTQLFTQRYQTVQVPKSGSIGLGTIQGTVGVTKTRLYVTTTGPANSK